MIYEITQLIFPMRKVCFAAAARGDLQKKEKKDLIKNLSSESFIELQVHTAAPLRNALAASLVDQSILNPLSKTSGAAASIH